MNKFDFYGHRKYSVEFVIHSKIGAIRRWILNRSNGSEPIQQ